MIGTDNILSVLTGESWNKREETHAEYQYIVPITLVEQEAGTPKCVCVGMGGEGGIIGEKNNCEIFKRVRECIDYGNVADFLGNVESPCSH